MISVLVPYRPDGGHHDRNWAWTRRRWETLFPDCELVIDADDGGSSPAEFNHPLALNRAAERAHGELLLVADIDIVPDPGWLAAARQALADGAPWVVADEYHKVDEASTEQILAGDPAAPIGAYDLDEPAITSSCAPPLLIPREGFDAAGGYDERIAWWGADDGCFRVAVDTLWGPMRRCGGAAVHLWHPPVRFHHERQPQQQELVFRYIAAAGDPEAVKAVQAA